MDDTMKDLITSNEDLKEAADKDLEQSRQAAQLDSLEKAQPSKDDTKMVDWGDSFRITIGMWMQSIPRMIIGLLKESVFSYLPRQREALTDASTVVSSSDLSKGFGAYRERMMDVDKALDSSPMLKYYGGENAKQSYLGLKGVTGGLNYDDLTSDSSGVRSDMETLAAGALQAGMNLDDFANKVKDGITALGLSQDSSEKFIKDIADRAKQLNLEFDSLYSNINSANGSLRQWGHSLNEAYGIASLFAKELEQGKMAIGDIVEYASALHNAGEGQSLFLLDQMSRGEGKGGKIATAIKEKAGNDPMAERNLFRRASEGHPGIAKELGLNMSDSKIRRDLRTLAFKEIEKMVVGIAGDNKYKQNEIRRKLQEEFFGISSQFSEASREKIQRNIEAGGASRGLSKTPVSPKKEAEDVEKLKKDMISGVGDWDKLWVTAKSVIIQGADTVLGKKDSIQAGTSILNMALDILKETGDQTKFQAGVKKYEKSHEMAAYDAQDIQKSLRMVQAYSEDFKKAGKADLSKQVINLIPIAIPRHMSDKDVKNVYDNIISGGVTKEEIEQLINAIDKAQFKKMTRSR
jgi:hypothetical protein